MRYVRRLFVLLTLFCLLWLIFVFPDTVARLALQQQMNNATLSPRQDHRPDISHCMNKPKLWECIVNKE